MRSRQWTLASLGLTLSLVGCAAPAGKERIVSTAVQASKMGANPGPVSRTGGPQVGERLQLQAYFDASARSLIQAGVINDRGAVVLSNNGSSYRLQQSAGPERLPLANAPALLADAKGQPIVGSTVVLTDARGRASLVVPPAARTQLLQVLVYLKTGQAKEVPLRALVVGDGEVQVDLATTVGAARLLQAGAKAPLRQVPLQGLREAEGQLRLEFSRSAGELPRLKQQLGLLFDPKAPSSALLQSFQALSQSLAQAEEAPEQEEGEGDLLADFDPFASACAELASSEACGSPLMGELGEDPEAFQEGAATTAAAPDEELGAAGL
jgi:hypothetical protein